MNRAIVSLCCLVVGAALARAGEARRDLTPRVYTSLPFDHGSVRRPVYASLPEEGRGHARRVTVAFARSMIPDAVRWAGKAVCPIYAVVEYGGELVLCKGGVFDYREFDLPPGRALTREDFRKLMDSGGAPPAPEWTRSYRVDGGRGAAAAE